MCSYSALPRKNKNPPTPTRTERTEEVKKWANIVQPTMRWSWWNLKHCEEKTQEPLRIYPFLPQLLLHFFSPSFLSLGKGKSISICHLTLSYFLLVFACIGWNEMVGLCNRKAWILESPSPDAGWLCGLGKLSFVGLSFVISKWCKMSAFYGGYEDSVKSHRSKQVTCGLVLEGMW